jgi:predicted AAA+ superfamily ATPase
VAVSPNTVKKYIQILEALYIVFKVTPYSQNIARSLLKEPKIYFFDGGLVKGNNGSKLENLVAVCLLKEALAKTDRFGILHEVKYLQTKERQEVDFAIQQNDQIEKIIEVKSNDAEISSSLKYFHDKYNLEACQIVKELKRERENDGIQVLKADRFLKGLFL